MFDGWNSEKTWDIKTRTTNGPEIDGTTVIGLFYIFLAYFLHPIIARAYHRVRAYRAWRSIEKDKTVEVTNYSMVAEVFGGRRKWDAARIITVLLVAFSVASWGLELGLNLAFINEVGDLDLLNRPPPVFLLDGDRSKWQVMSPELVLDEDEDSDPSIDKDSTEGTARSRYRIGENREPINGGIVVAWWSNNVENTPNQFYHDEGSVVEGIECDGETDVQADVYNGDGSTWGSVVVCENGPKVVSSSLESNSSSPPTIILNSSDSDIYVVVEESSIYPSFMYSVWTPIYTENSIELSHNFYIASTMRLAEAVTTGIVYGGDYATGRGCFSLLRQFSSRNTSYSEDDRARPFGERPTANSSAGKITRLSEVEKIETGVEVGVTAICFAAFLMVLTSIGFALSLLLHSSIGMDVYNRDELIRAVTLPGATAEGTAPSAMRIFVRKEGTGNISVIIDENGNSQSDCIPFLGRGGNVVENDDLVRVATASPPRNGGSGNGSLVPAGSRTVRPEGVETGVDTSTVDADGNSRYPRSVALGASPGRQGIASMAGTPTDIRTGKGTPVSRRSGNSRYLRSVAPGASPARSSVGSMTGTPTGARTGKGTPMSRRGGQSRYPRSVALSASPARSSVESTVGTPAGAGKGLSTSIPGWDGNSRHPRSVVLTVSPARSGTESMAGTPTGARHGKGTPISGKGRGGNPRNPRSVVLSASPARSSVGSSVGTPAGARTGLSTSIPDRDGNDPRAGRLSASPARSGIGSTAATPLPGGSPSSSRPPKNAVMENPTMFGARGASVLFDNSYQSGDDNEKDGDDADKDDVETGGVGVQTAAFDTGRGKLGIFDGDESRGIAEAGLRGRVEEDRSGLQMSSDVPNPQVGKGSPTHARGVASGCAHASPQGKTTFGDSEKEKHNDSGPA